MTRLALKKLKRIIAGILLVSASTFTRAQNVNGFFSGTAQTLTYIQQQYVLAPIPSATITVCNYPATIPTPNLPCTNLATLFAGSTATSGPAPAAFAADQQGNFGFWAGPGYYAYTVTNLATNVTSGPYSVVASSGLAGGGGGATLPFPGIVFGTSGLAGTVATSPQIVTALNTTPSSTLAPSLLPLATTSAFGAVKPDGTSVTVTNGVISSVPPTVTIPATSFVIKGTGVANVATAASPGTDYVIPSGSITGSAASLSAASLLPNGTTAVTQTTGDNTTKIATDAFVIANAGSGGGATTPATTNLLKGNGSVNGVLAATPGTDYVIPSGTVANLSGTPALPNGTSGTTQTVGDNTTKLATDAFVLANSSGSVTIPATTNVLKGTGVAGISAAATPGTDYLLPSALPATTSILKGSGTVGSVSTAVAGTDYMAGVTAPGYGYVPVSTGAGGTYSAQGAILQFGANNSQFVVGPNSSNLWSTLAPSSMNKTFWVEGFAHSGTYSGVGTAPSAWASGPDYGFCQVVSNSGTDWISVQNTGTGSTAPGTNVNFWMPYPNFQAATQLDCAWYMGQEYKHSNHASIALMLGAATYSTNGLIDYVDGSSFDDEFAEGLIGCGISCSTVSYTGSAAVPVIKRPNGGGNFASQNYHDFTVDGGGVASADMELDTLNQSQIYNIDAGHVVPGADHDLQIAHSGGFGFQVALHDINIGLFPDNSNGTANCGVFTANVVGGSITSYTVNTPGTCYHAATASNVYHVQVRGYGSGNTATLPCTVMPVGQAVTLSGTGIASISEGSNTGGSGCSGTIYVQVYSSQPVNYGVVVHNSDSHIEDITSYVGDLAAFYIDGGNLTATHLHPSVVPNGIISNASGALMGTEIDDVFDRAFTFNQPFATTGLSVTGTNGYIGCNGSSRLEVGSSMYYFAASTTNVNIAASASLQDDGGSTSGCNTGWQEFVTQSGPIQSPTDFATKAPVGFGETGNDRSITLPATIGDYIPSLAVGTFTGSTTGISGLTTGFIPKAGSATTITANSHLDDGITTGSVVTDSEGLTVTGALIANNTSTFNNTVQITNDVTITGSHNLILRNSGGSQQEIEAGASVQAWFFKDAGSSIFEQNLYSATSGSIAKGPVYTSDSCIQWGSTTSGSATPTVQGFLCEPSANTYSFGSTSGGTDGTIQAASFATTGSGSGSVALSGSSSGTLTLTVPSTVTSYTMDFPSAQPTATNTTPTCTAANPSVCTFTGQAVVRGTGTFTTATSDSFTVTGATSSSICTFSPTNSTAAAITVLGYISSVTTNSVTISHAATSASGGTVNVVCTLN